MVLIPARFTRAEEQQWVTTMLDRLAAGDRRRSPSDAELAARADELSRRYLGGLAKPTSIRWVANQASRWGSCTPADGTIRISTRVRGMPGYVLDYVVLHELAHLIVPGHGKDFWRLVDGFPAPSGPAATSRASPRPRGSPSRTTTCRPKGRASRPSRSAQPSSRRAAAARARSPRRSRRAGRQRATTARRGTPRSRRSRRRPVPHRHTGGRGAPGTARSPRPAGRGGRGGRVHLQARGLRSRTPPAPRASPPPTVASPGSKWPPNCNHIPALAWSVSSTLSRLGLSTSALAVRWAGGPCFHMPSSWSARCPRNWVRSVSWPEVGGPTA